MKYLLVLFIGFIIIHLIHPLFLPSFIPDANFPYKDLLKYNFSFHYLTPFANFDGYQYISIAKIGYSHLQQGYFPLFPTLLKLFSPLFLGNYILTGIILNSLFLFLGLLYFYKYAKVLLKSTIKSKWADGILLTFPTSFFYLMIYPESLFFFLTSGTFYYLSKRQILLASLFAYFASLTKIQGIFLLIPFLLFLFFGEKLHFRKLALKDVVQFVQKKYTLIFLSLFPLFGLLSYSIYLFITYGDPLYFYHTQSSFGANRATDKLIFLPQVFYRYIKIFLTADVTFSFWIALLEFMTIIFVLSVLLFQVIRVLREKEKKINELSLYTYSFAAIILPTLTGTFTSVPRYVLISLGFFIALAKIKNNYIKIAIVLIFSIFQLILFSYFLKGYFIS